MIDDTDKRIISLIQGDLPLDPRPFALLAERMGISEEEFISRTKAMVEDGAIRRFGAILYHREAGIKANAMGAWLVPEDRIEEAGKTLAGFKEVTHCYQRNPQKGWRYNLYTMIHGKSEADCRAIADRMSRSVGISDYQLLFSEKEFKKTSMEYFQENIMNQKSQALFQRAVKSIPGGVNSPVRAGKAVGVDPLFISRAEGCFLWDADGNRYIDYVCSWGPMILGHGHPEVIKAIQERIPLGASYGAPTELEVAMAEMIIEMVPSIEMVRMVNSGTEATMSAIRLARGFTGRDKIVKFDGCYHGHADSLLVSAGSGVATLGIPGSPGVPRDLARHTISIPYNNMDAVIAAFETHGKDITAVIVEPVAGNMGLVLPHRDFLSGLRLITKDRGALLIFDEVITGFRVGLGGAQEFYNIMPDLTCLGKIIGGGLPVGAYGGRREIMERMAPQGDIYQAGTLSGNPLAMAAGIATLKILRDRDVYQDLEEKGQALFSGLQMAAQIAGQSIKINRIGSMGSVFFTSEPVTDYASAKKADAAKYAKFYKAMRERGVYLAPSAFETAFVSLAHDKDTIQKTVECAAESLKGL